MATDADFERLGNWAQMKNPDANIDRRACTRKVPMKVLCLGFPRTGTLSMWEALEILGLSTYHYSSIFGNVRDSDMWCEALEAKARGESVFGKKEFDQLLGHVSAVTDVPCVLFWRELLECYPDAKVVLIQRDEDRWMKSMELLLDGVLNPVGRYAIRFLDPWWHGRIVGCGMAWIRCSFGTTDLSVAKRNARAACRKHYRDIRAAVPKERLLEYELGQGWEPLCHFLEEEVPDLPFPKRNDAQSFKLVLNEFLGRAVKNSMRNISVVVSVGSVLAALVWNARSFMGF